MSLNSLLWKLRGSFGWLSGSRIVNSIASHLWNAIVCRGHAERLRQGFARKGTLHCDFCDGLLFMPDPADAAKVLEYGHCRKCGVLFSSAPMPDYDEQTLYAPSTGFIDENVAHYQRLFLAHPQLSAALQATGTAHIIDLAGGIGIFPRMIANTLPELKDIQIVEVGEYANDDGLHAGLSQRLDNRVPLSFVRQNVFSFLGSPDKACPERVLISFVHFIDHLRQPKAFLKALRTYAEGCEAYVFVYCHALDSYKGPDWFVINTGTRGEHQIIYSHRALRKLLGNFGRILHGQVYFDDQYLLVKLDT